MASTISSTEIVARPCFVCNRCNISNEKRLIAAFTSVRNVSLAVKISSLLGNEFYVIVSEDDCICRRCFRLFDQMDKLENDLETVTAILNGYLKDKYGLPDDSSNLKVTAESYETVEDDHIFIINGHESATADALVEHTAEQSHQQQQPDGNSQIRGDVDDCRPIEKHSCGICNISYTDIEPLNRHIDDYHTIKEITDYKNSDNAVLITTVSRCVVCCKTFTSDELCRSHFMQTHLHKGILHEISDVQNLFDKEAGDDCVKSDVNGIEFADNGTNISPVSDGTISENKSDTVVINKDDNRLHIVRDNIFKKDDGIGSESVHDVNDVDSLCSNFKSMSKSCNETGTEIRVVHNDSDVNVCEVGNENVDEWKEGFDNSLSTNKYNCCSCYKLIKYSCNDCNKFFTSHLYYKKHFKQSHLSSKPSKLGKLRLAGNGNTNIHVQLKDKVNIICEKCIALAGNTQKTVVKSFGCKINYNTLLRSVPDRNELLIAEGSSCNNFINKRKRDSLHERSEEESVDVAHSVGDNITENRQHSTPSQEKNPIRIENDEVIIESSCEKNNINVNITNDRIGLGNRLSMNPSDTLLFHCKLCRNNFKSLEIFEKHIKAVELFKQHYNICVYCTKRYEKQSDVEQHITDYHKDIECQKLCGLCNLKLPDNEALIQHLFHLHHMKVIAVESAERVSKTNDLFSSSSSSSSINASISEFKRVDKTRTNRFQNPFYCTVCKNVLYLEVECKTHYKFHINVSSYCISCLICNVNLPESMDLESHSCSSDGQNAFNCAICAKRFGDRESFCGHVKDVHSDNYKCHLCTKRFRTKSHFIGHIEYAHRDNLTCCMCDKSFDDWKKLMVHEKAHRNCAFDCELCGKVLKTKCGLKVHRMSHTGRYPFMCEFCGQGFASSYSLEAHRGKHICEDRYVCDVCGKRFRLYDTYHKHRRHHDNPYPNRCNICKRHFRSSSRVAEHKRKDHTMERPYKCPYCPRSFFLSTLLKNHICIHTRVYPYRCTVCSRGFTARTRHAMHMLKAHSDDSFVKKRLPNNKERCLEWSKFSRDV